MPDGLPVDVRLSRNFRLSEFASRDGALMPWWVAHRLRGLCITVAQPIRDRLGVPMTIRSGWRSPAHNTRVQGALRSRHTIAASAMDLIVAPDGDSRPDAMDFDCRGALGMNSVYWIVNEMQESGAIPMGGLAYYPPTDTDATGFVHVDARGVCARWGKVPPR